jgi:hypothetical protein
MLGPPVTFRIISSSRLRLQPDFALICLRVLRTIAFRADSSSEQQWLAEGSSPLIGYRPVLCATNDSYDRRQQTYLPWNWLLHSIFSDTPKTNFNSPQALPCVGCRAAAAPNSARIRSIFHQCCSKRYTTYPCSLNCPEASALVFECESDGPIL